MEEYIYMVASIILVGLTVSVAFRWFWNWYFKINRIVFYLRGIWLELKKLNEINNV